MASDGSGSKVRDVYPVASASVGSIDMISMMARAGDSPFSTPKIGRRRSISDAGRDAVSLLPKEMYQATKQSLSPASATRENG